MAPEVLAGKPSTTRSDIYSVGALLYQVAVGDFSQVVTADSLDRVPDAVLREDLKRCLTSDPQGRYAAAGELSEKLRSWRGRRDERARKIEAFNGWERVRSWTTIGLGAVTTGMGVIGSFATIEQMRNASNPAELALYTTISVSVGFIGLGASAMAIGWRRYKGGASTALGVVCGWIGIATMISSFDGTDSDNDLVTYVIVLFLCAGLLLRSGHKTHLLTQFASGRE